MSDRLLKEIALKLNSLVLASAAKARQDYLLIDEEDRYTDADIDEIEADILALVRGGAVPVSQPESSGAPSEAAPVPLTLNSYGRQCYDAGRASAQAESAALVAQVRALRDRWRHGAANHTGEFEKWSAPELINCAEELDALLPRTPERTTDE